MIRLLISITFLSSVALADPLPIDPLWKSESFRKSVTGSYGIDSRIEPRITVDEEFLLNESARKMAAGDRPGAINILADSSLLEKSPALLFSLATFEFEVGNLKSAAAHFSGALKQFPNFRDAHRNLAIVLVQQEKYKNAIEHLARAMELGSREAITMGLLGYCYSLQKHHRAALDAYRFAALTQPSGRQWKIGEAQALQALGRPREAASILQELINGDPTNLNIWLVQADNWIALDKPVDAIANLEMAHRAGELSPDATLTLGHLYLQNDLPALALARYESAITNPDPVSLSRAVEALELLSNRADWKRSEKFARQIAESAAYQAQLNDEATDKKILSRFHRQKALIKLETGNPAEGAKLVADWINRDPLDGLALILLARFKEEADSREEAEMLLERAEKLPQYAAAAHLAHGKLLVSQSEYAAAVKHLEQSLALKSSESLADYLDAVRELTP